MAKVNKTKYALLGVLNLMERSASGYDIKKFCNSSIGHFWNENYGHIYPVLQKMEKEELVTKKVEQTEGRPAKNLYSITKKGKEELEEWIMLPVEQEPFRSEFLLKIFLSKNTSMENIAEKIEQKREEAEKEIVEYSNIKNILNDTKKGVDKKKLLLWISTIEYGKYQAEASLKWCEETLKSLEEIKRL